MWIDPRKEEYLPIPKHYLDEDGKFPFHDEKTNYRIGSNKLKVFFIYNITCFDPVISNKMIAERGRYDMTDKERRAFMRKFIDSGELRIRSDRTNTLEKMIADQME